MWWMVAGVIAIGMAAWGPIASHNVEKPDYRVIEQHDSIEIREYNTMIVAETTAQGSRKDAINNGFRTIADYIFGNNTTQTEIAMTAPVLQQKSEDAWNIRFVMPSNYTKSALPSPNNPNVRLIELPKKRFAVIRFSGTSSRSNIEKHEQSLATFLHKKNITYAPDALYAFFNPPWTLPVLRRNEIMFELK